MTRGSLTEAILAAEMNEKKNFYPQGVWHFTPICSRGALQLPVVQELVCWEAPSVNARQCITFL